MQLMDFTVTENEKLAKDVYRILLTPDSSLLPPVPGQFVNLAIDGFYLRRPISVCDWDGQALTLLYKVVGEGTKKLAQSRAGQAINAICGLGNGYTPVPARRPLLLGGGVGVPPLYYLAKALVQAGQRPTAVLGFNTAGEAFYEAQFAALCDTALMTADGSQGPTGHARKGFVTHAMPELAYDALYCCGPEAMLKAVYHQAQELPAGYAQFSFEARMACGFGACMGCSCRTVTGYKRICREGPVLAKEEILWT
jgi:dihydroorotate dehydrogenase electron transfer subunit